MARRSRRRGGRPTGVYSGGGTGGSPTWTATITTTRGVRHRRRLVADGQTSTLHLLCCHRVSGRGLHRYIHCDGSRRCRPGPRKAHRGGSRHNIPSLVRRWPSSRQDRLLLAPTDPLSDVDLGLVSPFLSGGRNGSARGITPPEWHKRVFPMTIPEISAAFPFESAGSGLGGPS